MLRSQIDYRSEIPAVQDGSGGLPTPWLAAMLLIVTIGPVCPTCLRAGEATDAASRRASRPPADRREGRPSVPPERSKQRTESRVALKPSLAPNPPSTKPSPTSPGSLKALADESSISQALRMISECKARFREVSDYSCDFYKRERVDGKLSGLHVMTMKERTRPKSIYVKFQQPYRGREAIYVKGRNNGSVLAHDVGFTKFLAGTMELDPKGSRAMENNRHPITEAGIGELIDNVEGRWAMELNPSHSIINHYAEMQVGPHTSVVMIESIHPTRRPEFLFHKVQLYINKENGLPIRFEAYDWPKTIDGDPELVEEYTYLNLKLNVGLRETDFDPANSQYSFGRF